MARDQKPGCIRALGTVAPLKNAEGKVIGERMDNLIHASATDAEAKREIKLWFRPSDIPPAMHIYATKESPSHYYYKNGKLLGAYESGAVLIAAPGDIVWESDLIALEEFQRGQAALPPLHSIVAKYLINR